MRGVDDDFDLIVYVIAARTSAPEMEVLPFKLSQRNVRQIRFDSAMNVLRIYPSQSLTVFIQNPRSFYLHAKGGGGAAVSSWQFCRSRVFAPFRVQCVERNYAQLDDPRTMFYPIIIGIRIC